MTEENLLATLRILYVEDEQMTRNELSRFLKRRTPQVNVAENGLDALVQFEHTPPDILISDLRMPDMDGLELTKRIRDLGYDTPIIITSALSDSETILSAVDRNIVKYLVKPIDTNELESALHKIAQQLETRRSAFEVQTIHLPLDQRKEIEKAIARDVSALLKKSTGKGPKRLKVQIDKKDIIIHAQGMMTPLENTLIKGAQSPEALSLNRELLYKTIDVYVKSIIQGHLNLEVEFSKYEGLLRQDKESITYTIK